MNGQDIFVGSLATLLGGIAVGAALFNWEFCYQLRKAQWLDARYGRPCTRWAFASIGVLLIVLGLAIASGVRWYGQQRAFRYPIQPASAP